MNTGFTEYKASATNKLNRLLSAKNAGVYETDRASDQ